MFISRYIFKDATNVCLPQPIPPIHASIRSRFIRAPSLRSFSLTLRSNSSTASRSPSPPATASSRKSFFHLPSRPNSVATPKHSRSFSLSAMSMLQAEPTSVRVPASSAKWRPSVLGYFSSSSQVTIQDTEAAPPRPSLSSTLSRTSATSTTYLDHTTSPSRLSLVSSSRHRPQNPSHGGGSNFSVWSQPDILEESVASRSPSSRSGRGPLQDKSRSQNTPQMATASPKAKSASKLSLPGLTAIRGQRKKKLVISGIHEEDDGKMEAARRWCEVSIHHWLCVTLTKSFCSLVLWGTQPLRPASKRRSSDFLPKCGRCGYGKQFLASSSISRLRQRVYRSAVFVHECSLPLLVPYSYHGSSGPPPLIHETLRYACI